MTGNGSAPVELLAADRRAVFTYPDNTRNRFGRLSLHPWVALSGATRLEASLYLQHLRQRTVNGDAADIESCEMAGNEGLLCLESAGGDDDDDAAEAQVLDRAGQPLADTLGGEGYGVLNRSLTRSTAGGALVQLVDRRTFNGGENVAILGVSHDRSRTGFQSSTELGALTDSRSVAGLGSIIDQPDGSIAPVSLIARTRYTGFFIADTLLLGSRWSLELAGRYNSARVILADRLGAALNGNHHFSRFNPGIELDFRASPALKLNLGYAETSRAPTPAELACASEGAPCSLTNFFVGDPPLRQVVAKSWTGGLSGSFLSGSFLSGWTFDWRLSAWRTTNSHDIQFIAAGVRGRAFFRNVGRTRRQGAEATIKASRGPWTIHAGYAFTDATYRSALTLNSPDNPGADDAGRIMAGPGDQMPGVARHRAVISADFARQGFLIGADLQAQSGQYLFGDEANLQPRTRAFVIVKARAEIPLLPHLRLFGRVENMLNRHYETFGIYSDPSEIALAEAPGASDPRSLGPAAPRRWLAGLSYKY
ncbi:TonB-denpendent receptor [Sphingobium baderi LL03]|nr:TonB-denpendent receptor [Sphingobium baderi LL03]